MKIAFLADSFLLDETTGVLYPRQMELNKMILKFHQEAYINSGGIAVLIQLLAETKKHNQQIGITGLSEHFKKIFRMVGITKFAKIYNTREDALEGMS